MASLILPLNVLADEEKLLYCNQPLSDSAGLLWQLDKPGRPPDFLFGTMHHGGDWVEDLVASLEPWLSQTKALYVEIEQSEFSPLEMMNRALLPSGVEISQFFTEQEYQQIKVAVAQSIPEKQLPHMKPWYVFVNLQSQKRKTIDIMDTLLQKRFEQKRLPVFGLESVSEQVRAFDYLTLEQQAWLVKKALASSEGPFADLEQKLKVLYQQGSLKALWYALNSFSGFMGEDFENFNTKMLSSRTEEMANKLLYVLDQSNFFVAVGAFHLPGEKGLLCLLEKGGYELKPIPFSSRSIFIQH